MARYLVVSKPALSEIMNRVFASEMKNLKGPIMITITSSYCANFSQIYAFILAKYWDAFTSADV